jgi:hypothetical protein
MESIHILLLVFDNSSCLLEDAKCLLKSSTTAVHQIIFSFDQNKIKFEIVFFLIEDSQVCSAIGVKWSTDAANTCRRQFGL